MKLALSWSRRFGHDFSKVRVHTDEKAAESARAVNALAYTVGRHVVFGSGQYATDTKTGQRLLAHEITHVVQQDINSDFGISEIRLNSNNIRAEAEASQIAQNIHAPVAKQVVGHYRIGIQRQTPEDKNKDAVKNPKSKSCPPTVIEYIKKNCQIAKTASRGNCPYHVMLIQSGFENGWGTATNILKDNNYFGMHGEGDKGWRPAKKDPNIKLPIYSSAQQSFNAYCKRVDDHKITYNTDSQFIADVVRLLKFSVGTEEKYKTNILDMINRCKKGLNSCKEAKT